MMKYFNRWILSFFNNIIVRLFVKFVGVFYPPIYIPSFVALLFVIILLLLY